ncbi:MAG: ATP-binding protein [Bdellovibrio sp.]
MIQRLINPSKTNSFFLFGPRGSGKTTLLKELFPKDLFLNLLDVELFDELLLAPQRFKALIHSPENKKKRVIVDEIQKLPQLLDYVHMEIQESKRQFILTGSSARRLKQKGTNLLAGRAWVYNLFPLSCEELGAAFDLQKALQVGTLPEAYLVESELASHEYLKAYVSTYLQKEIQEEQWVRKLAPFRRFLAIAAQMNGKIINKSKIAQELGVDDVTISNYFEILEDTLLGFHLPAFDKSVRKAQKKAPKFYFIDTGIKRALDKTLSVPLSPQTFAFGDAFEHWFIVELKKKAENLRLDWDFSYVQTKDGLEIDLVVKRPGQSALQIEIKSAKRIMDSEAKTLETLGKDLDAKAERWIVSQDPVERKIGSTLAFPWHKAIQRIGK